MSEDRTAPLSPRLTDLRDRLAAGAATATAAFWAEVARDGAPLVEPDPASDDPRHCLVTFLWRDDGRTDNVVVVEWFTAVDLPAKVMARLPGTDVWYRTIRARSDVRTVYRLAPNDSLVGLAAEADWPARRRGWVLDPLNPRRSMDRPGLPEAERAWLTSSVLEGPDAPPTRRPEGAPPRPDLAGRLRHHRFASPSLGNERDVWVYTSPGAVGDPEGARAAGDEPALLVQFDGDRALDVLDVPQGLDDLTGAGTIPPVVAVLVGNVDRNVELPCHPGFADAVVGELLPWLRRTYRFTADPARSVVSGQSYGGLAALYLAHRHPEAFGLVLSQSGSFYWAPGVPHRAGAEVAGDVPDFDWLRGRIVGSERLPIRIYMDSGTLENRSAGEGLPTLLAGNRSMRDALVAKGYDVTYAEFPGGHDYLWWRETLVDGLTTLLG